MRREFFELNAFETFEETQAALDKWVVEYNTEREHQSLGDLPPIRRFELAAGATSLEVIDGEARRNPKRVSPRAWRRVVDDKGRVVVVALSLPRRQGLRG